jgi:type VI secretion system protein ImpJ
MSWTNPVIWHEGMFLRAQHFQQHGRWTEALVRARTAALGPWWWGVSDLAINREKLEIGQFALAAGSGVFADGTPFSIPDDVDSPAALPLEESARNKLVYLAVPAPSADAAQVATDAAGLGGRYGVREFGATDTCPLAPDDPSEPAALLIGRLKLRFMLEGEDRAGWQAIPIARIAEIGADRRVRLDDEWIPPALRIGASPRLTGFVEEVLGGLTSRIEELAGRLGGPGRTAGSQENDFMLLVASNRWQKLLGHWSTTAAVHPEQVYATFVQIAGELATFSEPSRKLDAYPAYRHDDLQKSFARLMADLRRTLAWVRDTGAEQIPLQQKDNWFRGRVHNTVLLNSGMFYLMVRADLPDDRLRQAFPTQVKIGAWQQLEMLVRNAIPGIAVSPLPAPPPQIGFQAGAVCFQLDRSSPYWEQAKSSAVLGLHVSNLPPNFDLHLWGVRT